MAGQYDNDYIFVHEGEQQRRKAEDLDIKEQEFLRKKRLAAQKYHGMDTDKDHFDDGAEIYPLGLHNEQNKHIKRLGPSTKGSAYVANGGIQFDYDNSIINLKVKPTHSVIGGVHKMKSPRPMKLSVDYGDKHSHINSMAGFSINLDVHPEKFCMNTDKIKSAGLRKLKVVKKSPKNGIKAKARENREDINELSQRLSGFVKKQKKSSSIDLVGGKNLDFSHVGITSGLNNKKKRGFSL
jgi:hypothetical protein